MAKILNVVAAIATFLISAIFWYTTWTQVDGIVDSMSGGDFFGLVQVMRVFMMFLTLFIAPIVMVTHENTVFSSSSKSS